MKIIVLGGGVIGVTTAYYLLKDGHEVTLIERQSGVAQECSHANGGFVAISQAVPWAAPGVPSKALGQMFRSDAPILIHAGQIPRMWRWGLAFMRAAGAEPSLDEHPARAAALAVQFRGAEGDPGGHGRRLRCRHGRRAQTVLRPGKPG